MKQKFIIGDVVMYNNKIMVVKEPKDEIYFDLYCPKEGLVYCYVGVDKIKPVSITREILKKNEWNKFKRLYGNDYCYRRKGYPTLNICSEKEVCFYWEDHDRSITTVHELQHLLFGLGLNSEMEM